MSKKKKEVLETAPEQEQQPPANPTADKLGIEQPLKGARPEVLALLDEGDDNKENNGQTELQSSLPEEATTLHKAVGVDGFSSATFWLEQGWNNLRNFWKRLLSDANGEVSVAKQALLEAYPNLFGIEEVIEPMKPEHFLAVRTENGVPIVECSYADEKVGNQVVKIHMTGFGRKEKPIPNTYAPRWMARMDENGYLVYTDSTTGAWFHRAEKNGELVCFRYWRNKLVTKPQELEPDQDGKLTYLDQDNSEQTVLVDDLELLKTGVYTQAIKDVPGPEGEVIDIKAGIKTHCPYHREKKRRQGFSLVYLPNLAARQRLKDIKDGKISWLARRAAEKRQDEADGFQRHQNFRKMKDTAKVGAWKDRRKGGNRR